jgi:murein L,D-transpeptidase YafK
MTWLGRFFRTFLILLALTLGLLALYLHFLSLPPKPMPPLSGQIDRILIEKSARRLTVFRDGTALRSYRIALGFTPEGDKERQGDGRTPEGRFRIDRRNAQSAFHLSLGLDYPQRDDLIRAGAGGYAPGGDIFIHGQPNAFAGKATLRRDWTAGCIAVADAEIEELWRITQIGTEVEIRP